jgi:hypothetical protein
VGVQEDQYEWRGAIGCFPDRWLSIEQMIHPRNVSEKTNIFDTSLRFLTQFFERWMDEHVLTPDFPTFPYTNSSWFCRYFTAKCRLYDTRLNCKRDLTAGLDIRIGEAL